MVQKKVAVEKNSFRFTKQWNYLIHNIFYIRLSKIISCFLRYYQVNLKIKNVLYF